MLSAVFMYCVTSGASGTTCAENATEERRQCHSLYSSTVSPSKLQHYELQKKKRFSKAHICWLPHLRYRCFTQTRCSQALHGFCPDHLDLNTAQHKCFVWPSYLNFRSLHVQHLSLAFALPPICPPFGRIAGLLLRSSCTCSGKIVVAHHFRFP
jgi:hypothetical protein